MFTRNGVAITINARSDNHERNGREDFIMIKTEYLSGKTIVK
jgi:hypothetical protein